MAASHLQVPISNTSSLLLPEKLPRKLSGLKRCRDIAQDSVSPEFKDAAVGLSLLCMLSAGFPPVSETSVSHAAVLFPRGWPGPFFYRQRREDLSVVKLGEVSTSVGAVAPLVTGWCVFSRVHHHHVRHQNPRATVERHLLRLRSLAA